MGGNLSGKICTYKDFSTNPSGDTKTCEVFKCNQGTNEGKYVCVWGTSGIGGCQACGC